MEEFTEDLNGVAGEYLDRYFADWRTSQGMLPAFVLSPHPEPTEKVDIIKQLTGAFGEEVFHS